MALQFRPYENPEPTGSEFAQQLGQNIQNIGNTFSQGLQQQLALKRQAMLDQFIQQQNQREQTKFDMDYGTPIQPGSTYQPTAKLFSNTPSGMEEQIVPTGPKVDLIKAFDEWRSKGMPRGGARPEFMGALGRDQLKEFQQANSPENLANARLKEAQADFYERRPGTPAGGQGAFSFIGVGGDGQPIFVNSKTLESKSVPVPGGTVYPKTPTDNQQNSALYGRRANEANSQLAQLMGEGFNPTSLETTGQSFLFNRFQPEQLQQYRQLKLNFIAAVLRKESGATIRPEEEAWADQQYFPQDGDNPGTVLQKEMNRQTSIQELNRIAGPLAHTGSPQTNPSSVMTATNPQTGEKIQSRDGGQTWEAVR